MIEILDVSKAYPNGVHALNHVKLKIDDGEFVYVIGATGSGKSTLIKILNGEIVPDEGLVIVNGTDVGALKHRKCLIIVETLVVSSRIIVCFQL